MDLTALILQANQSLTDCLLRSTPEKHLHHSPPCTTDPAQLQTAMQRMSIFDKIPDLDFEDNMETRISNHKMQLFTSKRKDLLFNRHRKEQEEKLTHQRAEVEKRLPTRDLSSSTRIAKNEFTLRNEVLNKTETFTITADDLDKLRPETDTNDTVIGSYIKLMQLMWLPAERDQKCHIFSSFFLEKLIGEYVKEEIVYDKDPVLLLEQVQAKVRENYKNVKRWTKKIDIFEKDLLVFPINAFRHWFCIIVLRPGSLLAAQPACELVYCDSMFDQRDFVAEAIRKYLECELEDKKTVKLVLDKERVPCYQLLLPRQTNTHDCGLYMISYIEQLLQRPQQLQGLRAIDNRRKLSLFPRTLIFTMRDRLRKLFTRLLNAKDEQEKYQILADYTGRKERIVKEASSLDYDSINEREYKKYEKMNFTGMAGTTMEEKVYACQVRFYYDPEINFYEKDK